ncbi:MAG: hypothetical protein IJS12_03205 [Lachnospiraceae bacterium]|nr:hypothetical protein [Lachnospiraceae bacterium]
MNPGRNLDNRTESAPHTGYVSRIIRLFLIYIATVTVLTGFLVLSAFIPRKLLADHMAASADYLCDTELFGVIWDGVPASKIDHYADSILLNIAWNYDSAHPIRSVMESSYYYRDGQNENFNLRDAVYDELSPNREYLRYWHGSVALVRPLLIIMSLQGIYIFWGVVLLLLLITLLWRLIRAKEYFCTVGIVLGAVLTFSWFVPFSLEYTWVYLVMLVSAHVIMGVSYSKPGTGGRITAVLMVSGIVCAYLDFLTAETLTLTVPLLLAVCLLARRGSDVRDLLFLSIRSAIAWAMGYAGMFVIKWGLASLILSGNALDHVTGNAAERVNGLVLDMAYFTFFGPMIKNFRTILPFSLGTAGAIAGVILLLGCVYAGYVHCRPGARIGVVLIYLAIAVIPLVRFIALRNHSVLHYFFTCRALLGTILGICLIMGETLGPAGTGRRFGGSRSVV